MFTVNYKVGYENKTFAEDFDPWRKTFIVEHLLQNSFLQCIF